MWELRGELVWELGGESAWELGGELVWGVRWGDEPVPLASQPSPPRQKSRVEGRKANVESPLFLYTGVFSVTYDSGSDPE